MTADRTADLLVLRANRITAATQAVRDAAFEYADLASLLPLHERQAELLDAKRRLDHEIEAMLGILAGRAG